MKLKDAVKISEKSDEVKELVKKGYFLNSGMAFLEEPDSAVAVWNLTYYEPKMNLVAQIVVDGSSVTVKEKGTPLQPTKQRLKLDQIKTSNENMLKKAKADFNKYKQPMSQIILSIQSEGERIVWVANFITKMLYLITVKLDAKTGEIISSEMNSLSKQG